MRSPLTFCLVQLDVQVAEEVVLAARLLSNQLQTSKDSTAPHCV